MIISIIMYNFVKIDCFYDGSLDNLLNNQEHLHKQWRE